MRQDETTSLLSRSFGEVAEEYDRLRPRPSDDALDFLIPSSASTVLEIGAGTGVLTRLLVDRLANVTAVEPDDRMRAVLAAGVRGGASIAIVAGTAEDLPAEDSSCDVVIAQSAWHWVDEERAIPEVARVLRPEGRLALLWSGPDRSIAWMRTLWSGATSLTAQQQADADARRRRRHVVNIEAAGPSPFDEPETKLFQWTRPMSKADLVALATTYSAVITMDDPARQRHLEAMMHFLESDTQFANSDLIDVPMRSYCWRASKR